MSKQDYALVSGGAILSMCQTNKPPRQGDFSDEFPANSQWLPVIDTDISVRPTDRSRYAPRYEVTATHVARSFVAIEPPGCDLALGLAAKARRR
jgi:hypothetical protein